MVRISFPYIAFDFSLLKWYTYITEDRHFLAAVFFISNQKEVTHGRVGVSDKTERKEGKYILKKIIFSILASIFIFTIVITKASASTVHTVEQGDSLWKIAVKYQVGLSEIKEANPSIKNYNLIYPGQLINVPTETSSVTAYESEVVRLVNEKRAAQGLKPLTQDWQLSRVARYKSDDMRSLGYFSHTSPTYGSPFEMMRSFGISYRTAGENIAKGYKTPEAVVAGWMNSPGHRANILNPAYTHIGVGYVSSGNYWTQMFISK